RDSGSYSYHYYGHWGDMVLLEGRFPCVIYLDRTSGSRLRCVEWTGGARRDEIMFSVPPETAAVRVAASGKHVSVSWMVYNQANYYGTIMHSMRVDGAWTTPEQIVMDQS